MFYSLATVVCLAVLFIVAAGSSLVCSVVLRLTKRSLLLLSPGLRAGALFVLRAIPLFLAGLVTLGFALPAFLRFEPPATNEPMGARLLILAAFGGLVFAVVVVRGWRILRATRRARKQCEAESRPLKVDGVTVPIYCSATVSPLLGVSGIFRPQIFVSEQVTAKLSPSELFAAVTHELAHVTAYDNLKQLILKITALPKWLGVSSSSYALWLNASEIAADEGALAGGASALDLSSALVKVAGLSRSGSVDQMVLASHLLPVSAESCIEARVSHLRKLLENEQQIKAASAPRYLPLLPLLALSVCYLACVNALLPWMHEILELLVR